VLWHYRPISSYGGPLWSTPDPLKHHPRTPLCSTPLPPLWPRPPLSSTCTSPPRTHLPLPLPLPSHYLCPDRLRAVWCSWRSLLPLGWWVLCRRYWIPGKTRSYPRSPPPPRSSWRPQRVASAAARTTCHSLRSSRMYLPFPVIRLMGSDFHNMQRHEIHGKISKLCAWSRVAFHGDWRSGEVALSEEEQREKCIHERCSMPRVLLQFYRVGMAWGSDPGGDPAASTGGAFGPSVLVGEGALGGRAGHVPSQFQG
jgi:hypothetical protein